MSRNRKDLSGFGRLGQEQIQKLQAVVDRKKKQQSRPPGSKEPDKGAGELKPLIVPDINGYIPFVDTDGSLIRASPGCVRLAEMAATAAYNRSSCFAFIWPARGGELPLVHVLATLSLYASFDSRELRTLYWPAKANTTAFLRKQRLYAEWLRSAAARFASQRDQDRDRRFGAMSLRTKTRILLRLEKAIQHVGPGMALSECIHAFYRHTEDGWVRKPKTPFEDLTRSISGTFAKNETRQWAQSLAMPQDAKDSLFCLHRDTNLQDMKQALEDPCFDPDSDGLPPNLAILDLRAANWFMLEKKWAKTMLVFDRFQNRGPIGPAGVLAVTDSPWIMERLRAKFTRWHFHPRIAPGMHRPRFHAVPAGEELGITAREEGSCRDRQTCPDPERFSVQILGRPSADIAGKFEELATKIAQQSRKGAAELRAAARDITDISMLPGGWEALDTWLSGRSEAGRGPGRRFSWNQRKIELLKLLDEGELGDDYVLARKLIDEADSHIGEMAELTPAGKALEEVLDKATAGDRAWACENLLVTADTKPAMFLCRDAIDSLLGPDNGIKTILSRDLPEFCPAPGTGIVHLVSRHECLRYLFMLKEMPAWCRIILGHSRAAAVSVLFGIILNVREMECFHPLAQRLKELITKNILTLPPDQRIRLDAMHRDWDGLDFSDQSHEPPGDKVTVWLDEHPRQYFAPGSSVYILDPDSSWGYRSATAMEIQEDDTLLLIPKEIMDSIGENLERVEADAVAKAKEHVLVYQTMVKSARVRETGSETGSIPATAIADRINSQYGLDSPVTPATLRRWFKAGEESEARRVIPYAPKAWEHFRIFCSYLGLTEDYINKLHFHVRVLRNSNRQEGKRQKKEVLSLLADRLDHLGRDAFPEEMIEGVRQQAKTHSYRVCRVKKPDLPE